MSLFSRKSITQKVASLFFRLQGIRRLDAEQLYNHWKSESQGALLKLIRNNKANSFGMLHNFHRIKNHTDFQRLIPIGDYTGHDYKNQQQSEKDSISRAKAITRIFELIAGWHTWPLFSQDWLIASNLYSPALNWTHLPSWLKLLSCSPAESFNPNWNGIFTSADCLALGTLDSILEQRGKSFPNKPALVLAEFGSEEIGLIDTLAKKIPDYATFVPIWRELARPIAIADPCKGLMRFVSLENLYLELLVNNKNQQQKRFALESVAQGMEGEVLLSGPEVWAKPTGVFVKIEDANQLYFRFLNRPEKTIGKNTIATMPLATNFSRAFVLSHPQKVGTSATLAKTSSHSPW